jgi:hypothetical protein
MKKILLICLILCLCIFIGSAIGKGLSKKEKECQNICSKIKKDAISECLNGGIKGTTLSDCIKKASEDMKSCIQDCEQK